MGDVREENAVIRGTRLGMQHGIFTADIQLHFDGGDQCFGGYVLYRRGELGCTGCFIQRVLEIAGVREWGKLEGIAVRVRGTRERIEAIGHIIDDDWFNPRDEFAELRSIKDG